MKIKRVERTSAVRHRGKRIQKTPGVNEEDEGDGDSRVAEQMSAGTKESAVLPRLRIKINEHTYGRAHQSTEKS